MKRTIIITLLCALAMSAAGCRSGSSSSSEAKTTAAASTATVSTEAETEAVTTNKKTEVTTTTTAAVTEAPTETESQTDAPFTDAPSAEEAKNIAEALEIIDRMQNGAFIRDDSDKYVSDNGTEYFEVEIPGLSSIADIEAYMNKYMTASFISDNYADVIGTDDPVFIEKDGKLYGKVIGRGRRFSLSNPEPRIEATFTGGYSLFVDYNDYGAPATLEIDVIPDSGWKICNLSFGL